MKFRNALLPIVATFAIVAVIPAPVMAQDRGTAVQQSENARAAAELRTRIGETETRIGEGQSSRVITRARASQLRRQITQMRQSMTRLLRRQGFVSAAELATYHRTLASIGKQLDVAGVARSYGDDALPSAEMIAFKQLDARLHYRNARTEYDGNGCAVYQGLAPGGHVRREPMLSSTGQPICVRR